MMRGGSHIPCHIEFIGLVVWIESDPGFRRSAHREIPVRRPSRKAGSSFSNRIGERGHDALLLRLPESNP